MLPYLKLQLVYFLLAAIATGGIWILLGRLEWCRTRMRRRYGGSLFVIVSAFLAVVAFGRPTIEVSRGFISVAFAFYGGGIVLPLIPLGLMVAGRRKDLQVDRPLMVFCVGSLIVCAYSLFVEPDRLQLRRESITLGQWSKDVPPFRIAHISDLQTVGHSAREDRAVEMVNGLDPDLIIVTGDYIAGPFSEIEPAVNAARRFLGALRARHGVVVVQGHSESEEHRRLVFKDLGLRYLVDDVLDIHLEGGRGVRVYGSRIHGSTLGSISTPPGPGTINILASHVPDLQGISGTIDLHLAGHTHGGQVVIPFYGAPFILSDLPRRFARGLHRVDGHWLNVSAGLGMEGNHAPRIRFLCPPEICLVSLVGGGT